MTFDYESWLKKAQDRLEELYQQRAAIDEEIAALQRGIEGFSPLLKKAAPWEQESLGITEAVTRVFTDAPGACFTAVSVRDGLLERGMELKQQNPLATIHQIISRLVGRGVLKTLSKDGRTLYFYDPSQPLPEGAISRYRSFRSTPQKRRYYGEEEKK